MVALKASYDSKGTQPKTAKRNDRNETSETSKTKQVYWTFWCVVWPSIFVVCILHNSYKYSAILQTKTSRKLYNPTFFSAKSFSSFLIKRGKQCG